MNCANKYSVYESTTQLCTRVIFTIVSFIVCICASISNEIECDFFCDVDNCKTSTNNNVSTIKFCTNENMPNGVNFTLINDETNNYNLPAKLQINFVPPKEVCKYEVTLLANESISEERCTSYNFQNLYGTEVHTKSTICFISNNHQYQNSIDIPFQYIFTACYAVQIYFGKGRFVRNNKFLKTNYSHTEVTKPKLKCVYDIVADNTKNKELHFVIDFSTPVVKKAMLQLGSLYNYTGEVNCDFKNENISNKIWSFNVLEDYLASVHNFDTNLVTSGIYETRMNFTIKALGDVNYCILVFLFDSRCQKDTLWKPPTSRYNLCEWFKECQYVPKNFGIQTDSNTNFYLFLSIVIITLTMFSMLGVMYLLCTVYVCNVQQKMFYINASKNTILKTDKKKYNRMNVCSLKKKKEMCENINVINTDIVLLYPKSSTSFMTLMADFREMLSRVCQCYVYDWYDGVECNRIAEIGGSDWFAEMLNKGSRVLWIDTPTMRSLIKPRFKENFFISSLKQDNFIEITDFRDILFPVIFNRAKHNLEESPIQQHKHFIIRLNGFENFGDSDDPFIHLFPQTRYLIPQDLKLLFSILSISKSEEILSYIQEENLIERRLHDVEVDFYK